MSDWLPLPPRERRLLLVICGLSAVALLPVWREGSWLGVSNLAWALAILMIVSPLLAFVKWGPRDGGKR